MPVNATVEVLQGPNNNRQGIELYTDDGRNRPVFYTLETPGYGCVVRVNNVGPMEFPMTASVVPDSFQDERMDMMGDPYFGGDVVIGGEIGSYGGPGPRGGPMGGGPMGPPGMGMGMGPPRRGPW